MVSIAAELMERIRERGVRVEERLALLRLLLDDGDEGETEIRRRLADLEQQIREAARKVRGVLR